MKTLAAFLILVTSYFAGHAQTGTVILNVAGINPKKGGVLSAAIFTKPDFLKTGKQVKSVEANVTDDKMQLIITDVPPGNYAIAVFQDIDMNKDLKTNFIGFPVEPFGFSNNARIKFGPPSFEDASFATEKDKQTVLMIMLH